MAGKKTKGQKSKGKSQRKDQGIGDSVPGNSASSASFHHHVYTDEYLTGYLGFENAKDTRLWMCTRPILHATNAWKDVSPEPPAWRGVLEVIIDQNDTPAHDTLVKGLIPPSLIHDLEPQNPYAKYAYQPPGVTAEEAYARIVAHALYLVHHIMLQCLQNGRLAEWAKLKAAQSTTASEFEFSPPAGGVVPEVDVRALRSFYLQRSGTEETPIEAFNRIGFLRLHLTENMRTQSWEKIFSGKPGKAFKSTPLKNPNCIPGWMRPVDEKVEEDEGNEEELASKPRPCQRHFFSRSA